MMLNLSLCLYCKNKSQKQKKVADNENGNVVQRTLSFVRFYCITLIFVLD